MVRSWQRWDSRARKSRRFLSRFLIVGLPFGLVAGAVIDRVGAKWVILAGAALVGTSLLLMARMTKLWQYEALCVLEVLGYVLRGDCNAGAGWRDGSRAARACDGIAYLGLGAAV